MREKKGNTNSITSLPKFSLQTEPKSHASTYYSVNNAVRQDAIQLSAQQQKAFVFRRLASGLGKMGQQRRPSRESTAQGERLFDPDGNYKAYCSSYSKSRRGSQDSTTLRAEASQNSQISVKRLESAQTKKNSKNVEV